MWYGIILFVGLILLSIGIYKFNESLNFLKIGDRVAATVVELESYKDSDGDMLYRPIFVYKHGYEERRFIYRMGSRPASWKVGEEATLIVASGDPDKVIVLTYFGVFSWTIVLIAIALPMIFIGGGYFWANNFLQRMVVHP